MSRTIEIQANVPNDISEVEIQWPHEAAVCKDQFEANKINDKILNFPCSYCGKITSRPCARANHEKACHQSPKKIAERTCKICMHTFQNIQGFRFHQMKNEKKIKFSCSYCGKITSRACARANHEKACHQSPKKIAERTCKICMHTFQNIQGLRCHQMKNENKMNFSCSYCGKITSRPCARVNHEKACHQSPTKIAERTCKICMITFQNIQAFRSHQMNKHPVLIELFYRP